MKYRAIRKSYGFQGRFWDEGDIVDVKDGTRPPEHFAPLSEMPEAEPKPTEPETLSQLQKLSEPLAENPETLAEMSVPAKPKKKASKK